MLMRSQVQREDDGRGGSRAIHETWQIGTRINADNPINHFSLHSDDRPAVLIAGGIGITPIKAMAETLRTRGTSFELHYAGRTPENMAFHEHFVKEYPEQYHVYLSRLAGHTRMNVSHLLETSPANAVFYVCGPSALIQSVIQTANALKIESDRVQFESFY